MKRFSYLLLICTLVITSCGRNNDNEKEDEILTESAEDQAMAEALWDDVGEQVDGSAEVVEEGEDEWEACAIISIDSVGNPFPFNVTVDFGDGCTGRDGKVRKGKLLYELTGWMRLEGSSLSVTPEDYFVDDYSVAGKRSTTNLGENSEGQLEYEIKVEDATVIDPDGKSITWNSERIRTWVEGRETGFFTLDSNGMWMGWAGITDDVYEITGTADGVNRNGIAYDVEITDPLRVQLDCRWITQGTITLTPEGYASRTLDYGDGTCDSKATLTTRDQEREINLWR